MPRLVQKTAHGPLRVGDKDICMCGLSKNQPYCDQSHKLTLDEDEDKLYVYDQDGHKEEVVEGEDGCCGGGCCGNCEHDEEHQDEHGNDEE